MWLDLVRGSLVRDAVLDGKVGETWDIMGPQLRPLLSGDVMQAEILNDGLKEVWVSGKVVAKNPQAERSIGGRSWRALVWSTLSILSTTGNELPILGKMSERALPDWVRERARVSIQSNPKIFQDPNFILLKIDVGKMGTGVASPEALRDVLEESPDLVTQIDILWCKTQFSDTIKENMLWSQIGQLTQAEGKPTVKHCFVTVPNASRAERLSKGSIQAMRAETFDGGSYWGIGDMPGTPMKGVFDIIPDWRDRIEEIHKTHQESLLCKRLGLLD